MGTVQFNGSVNIPESSDFRSQFDPKHNFLACFINTFLSAYTFINEKI